MRSGYEIGNFNMLGQKMRIGLILVFGLIFSASQVWADTPSVKVGNPDLVDPTNADSFYGAVTTHSPGIAISQTELNDLARALRYDPVLIYEYVRNRIEIEARFGLAKGAFGAHLDESGTAFDQANLLVSLLRIANTNSTSNISASYKYGTITITGQQFTDWFGISDAKAACFMLARGGFPGTVNGSSGACSGVATGTISSVTMNHVWVEVTVDGSTYDLDPSYKTHTFLTGINLGAEMGYSSSGVANAASIGTGSQSGVSYVNNVSAANIENTLQGYATNLLGHIENSMANDVTMEDVIGGQEIDQALVDQLSTQAPPYTLPTSISWTDIPDQFRTVLSVDLNPGGTNPAERVDLFTDQTYGRVVQAVPSLDAARWQQGNNNGVTIHLQVDGTNQATYTRTTGGLLSQKLYTIDFTINHPYAAADTSGAQANGSYMDRATTERGGIVAPMIIVQGFGYVSQALFNKLSNEAPKDHEFPEAVNSCGPGCEQPEAPTPGGSATNGTNMKMAANWLAQLSRMAELQSEIGDSYFQHHHSIGIVFNETNIQVTGAGYFFIADQMTRLDVQSGVSVTHETADISKERGFIQAFAATASGLEGSVFEQMLDTPDTVSTAERFDWGAKKHPMNLKFNYLQPADVTNPNLSSFFQVDVDDICNGVMYCPSNVQGNPYPEGLYTNLTQDHVEDFLNAGYKVLLANDTFLGPGYHMGYKLSGAPTHDREPSAQRGAAFIAIKEDANGNITEISHVVTSITKEFKGGGAAEDPNHIEEYKPSEAADILKDRFEDRSSALGVDLSTGSAGYSSGSVISVGSGGFPFEISAEFQFQTGARFNDSDNAHFYGMSHNWDIELSTSGSGMGAMGASSPKDAVASIVAFYAMLDVASQDPNDHEQFILLPFMAHWWLGHMTFNTASVSGGANGGQFFKRVDGNWYAPPGSPMKLVQNGDRAAVRRGASDGSKSDGGSLNRHWDYSGIQDGNGHSFILTFGDGSVQKFGNLETGSKPPKTWFKLVRWETPAGVGVNLTYQTYSVVLGLQRTVHSLILQDVTNDFGRKLTFSMPHATGNAAADYILVSDDHGRAVRVDRANGAFTITNIDGTQSIVQNSGSHAACPANVSGRPYVGAQPIKMIYAPTDLSNPLLCYVYDSTHKVKDAFDAQAVLDIVNSNPDPRGSYEFFIAPGHRGERMDPLGGEFTVYYDEDGNAVEFIDELGRVVSAEYDGIGRVVERTFPELDKSCFKYDRNSNVIEFKQVAKGGQCTDTDPNTVRIAQANWDMTYNKPNWVEDFKDNRTNFVISQSGTDKGMVTSATLPTVPGPTGSNVTPIWSFAYTTNGQVDSVTDPTGVVTKNTYDAEGNLTRVAVDSTGSLNLRTDFEYDAIGNQTAAINPRGVLGQCVCKTTSFYDEMRRVFKVVGPTGEETRNFFDAAGRVVISEQQNGNTILSTQMSYTATGQELTTTSPDGAITTNFYDALDRVLEVHDPEGRVTRFTYDASGQLLEEIRAFGTPLQQVYSTFTYTDNGQQASISDANGNTSEFFYDGFDRLIKLQYPDPTTVGSSNPNDKEEFTYDVNGNVLTKITRAGDRITNIYDDLNRISSKEAEAYDEIQQVFNFQYKVEYFYSARGQQTEIRFADLSQHVKHTYDAAGRIVTTLTQLPGGSFSTNDGRLDYTYDAASNRTSIKHQNQTTRTFVYGYDASSRMTTLGRSTFSGSTPLATFSYDQIGRRTKLEFGNTGSVDRLVEYFYAPDSALTKLAHGMKDAADDVDYGFNYNLANQVSFRTVDNPTFQFAPVAKQETYASNGLNQYTQITRDTNTWMLDYDDNGNLTSDGEWEYTYDVENRLVQAYNTQTLLLATYTYDPLGRRVKKSVSGQSDVYYLSDGTEEVMELNASGDVQKRYIFGPGVDEPIAMYDGSGVASGSLLYYRADPQGSIVAITDYQGGAIETYTYDAYGNPDQTGGNAIRYTGRRWDPETGLYYYRARMYSPAIGRFLQTDPIGYGDNVNLYGYVGNDPGNRIDPFGQSYRINQYLAQREVEEKENGQSGDSIDTGNITFVAGPGATDEDVRKSRNIFLEGKRTKNSDGSKPDSVTRAEAVQNSEYESTVTVDLTATRNSAEPTNFNDASTPGKGSGVNVTFNPNLGGNFSGDNVPRDSESSLFHEVGGHGFQFLNGEIQTQVIQGQLFITNYKELEISATVVENTHRKANGLQLRTRYDRWIVPTKP